MSTQNPIRIAVIGCGLIAQRSHLPAYGAASEAEVVGLAAETREEAEIVARQFGIARTFPSWQEAIADPEIDAIDVCTPNALHATIAIAAARAGKHVLVEKPMTTSLEDADAMIDAARESGVRLMVAHNLRFSPVSRAMHAAILEGVLGRTFSARGVFMHAGPDESWGSTSEWFWREDGAGGGSLLDLGIHMIDLMRWVIGRPVLQVSAMTARHLKPTFADDNVMLTLRFEGDILGSIQSSWTARPFSSRELVIHGENGHLAMGRSADEPLVINLRDGDGWKKVVPELPSSRVVENPFSHFARSIQAGVAPLVMGEEGRASLAIALAAYESARTGRAVKPG